MLVRDLPRKQRQSLDNSPCHSKQSSEGDGLIDKHSPSFDGELHTVQEKKVCTELHVEVKNLPLIIIQALVCQNLMLS